MRAERPPQNNGINPLIDMSVLSSAPPSDADDYITGVSSLQMLFANYEMVFSISSLLATGQEDNNRCNYHNNKNFTGPQ